MLSLFGRKKQARGPTLGESIQQLREALEILEKREVHLGKQMTGALQEAKKKSQAKDKRAALFYLKKKKYYEKEVDKIYGKKTNIEVQILALESAASNTDVLSAMRKGADALKRTVKESDIDKVADVMEDINESMAVADELSEAMAQPIGPVMDDDELTKELESMEAELQNSELMKEPEVSVKKTEEKKTTVNAVAASLADAPSVPSHPVTVLGASPVERKRVAVVVGGSGGTVPPSASSASAKLATVVSAAAAATAPAPAASSMSPPVRSSGGALTEDEELAKLNAQMGMT